MKQNTAQVLAWIGLSEGGYVNHPRDPGGPTDRGITQATYDAWNRQHGRPPVPVRGISKATAEEILVAQYFAPVRFDDLPAGLDYAVVDYAINSGPSRAVRDLQRLVGVTADGIMGSKTLAAIAAAPDHDRLIEDYCASRLAFLKDLTTWADFGKGWSDRVAQVRARSLALADARAAPDVLPVSAPEKGVEADRRVSALVERVLTDPVAAVTAATPLVLPLLQSQAIQYALAGCVVLLVLWVGVRQLRRDE